MRKKICLYLGAKPSGGGTFQYNQAMIDAVTALPADQFAVTIVCSSALWFEYLNPFNVEKLLVQPLLVVQAVRKLWRRLGLPMSWWLQLVRRLCPVIRSLQLLNPDLCIFPSQDTHCFESGLPSLCTIHDLMHRYEKRFSEISAAGEYRNRELKYMNICRCAAGILVDSDLGKRQVMESYGLTADRLHVLPYVAPRYVYVDGVPEGFDDRYRLPPRYLFYPAQFWEHKNHRNLLKAMAGLKPAIPDLKLVLAGSEQGAYGATVKLIKELNLESDIAILGYVPDRDMPELYRRARALVMPTFFGPTNIPPLEAMALGCPVAVSKIYGMPEQVGDAALLFDPSSPEEMGDAILRLWTDDLLCAELSRKGRMRDQQWRQEHFNKRLEEIVAGILR